MDASPFVVAKDLEHLTVQKYLATKTEESVELLRELTENDIKAFLDKADALKARLRQELDKCDD